MKYADVEYMYGSRQGEAEFGGVRAMRTRIITAGNGLEVESYPVLSSRAARRAARYKPTTTAQKHINKRRKRKRMARLIEANFVHRVDYVLTLTYDYGLVDVGFANIDDVAADYDRLELPRDYDDAQRDTTNFLRRVKYKVRKHDPLAAVKYIYVIEQTKPVAELLPNRFHIHMVLHAPRITRAALEALWENGQSRGYTKIEPLCLDGTSDLDADRLAAYLTKSETSRLYHSKNMTEPTIETSDKALRPALAARIAAATLRQDAELLQALRKMYPGYDLIKRKTEVFFSEFLPGAYINLYFRRRDGTRGKAAEKKVS